MTVGETVRFLKNADRLMLESDRAEPVSFIAANLLGREPALKDARLHGTRGHKQFGVNATLFA
jgi:hypothetical protein